VRCTERPRRIAKNDLAAMKSPAFYRVRASLVRVALVVAFAAAIGGRASVAAETGWIAKSSPIRIMALGDSITAGVGARGVDTGDGGYRGELGKLLDAAGYRFEMTGSRSDFSAHMARARAHEGWPGYVIRSFPSDPGHELIGAVTRKALADDDPDVILLMAGTNDLLRHERHSAGYTVGTIVESMDALLGQIFFAKPSVDVILAGVVDSPYVSDCTIKRFDGVESWGCDEDEGPSLKTLVAKYRKLGFHIALAARMDAAVPRDREHFPDGIHPSGPGGYAGMARVWMRAIENETTAPDGVAVSNSGTQL
jgi:lysophospholipase L1-like esterase